MSFEFKLTTGAKSSYSTMPLVGRGGIGLVCYIVPLICFILCIYTMGAIMASVDKKTSVSYSLPDRINIFEWVPGGLSIVGPRQNASVRLRGDTIHSESIPDRIIDKINGISHGWTKLYLAVNSGICDAWKSENKNYNDIFHDHLHPNNIMQYTNNNINRKLDICYVWRKT